jgi:hypothetical protein
MLHEWRETDTVFLHCCHCDNLVSKDSANYYEEYTSKCPGNRNGRLPSDVAVSIGLILVILLGCLLMYWR